MGLPSASRPPAVITQHTELDDKEVGGTIDHADDSVPLAKLVNYPIAGTIKVAAVDAYDTKASDVICAGADDQVTINAALNALPATGGRVVLSEGTFVISGAIVIPDHDITLEGMGAGTIIKIKDSKDASMDMVSCTTKFRFMMKNLTLDGNAGNQASGTMHGFYNYSAWWSWVENCVIKDLRNYGMRLRTVKWDIVRNCRISGCDAGINVESGTSGLFEGNTFEANGEGLDLGMEQDNARVVGNLFINQTSRGMRNYRGDHVTIVGNTIVGTTGDGLVLDGCIQTTVAGNAICDNTGHGIRAESAADQLAITGNTVNYNGLHGIFLEWCNTSIVSGNVLVGNGQTTDDTYDGVYVHGVLRPNMVTGNRIHKGYAANETRYGITVEAGGVAGEMVYGNNLTGAGKSGEISDADGNAVTSAPIGALGNDTVGSPNIIDGEVGSPEIALDAIRNDHIKNGEIDLTAKGTYVPINKAGDTVTGNMELQTRIGLTFDTGKTTGFQYRPEVDCLELYSSNPYLSAPGKLVFQANTGEDGGGSWDGLIEIKADGGIAITTAAGKWISLDGLKAFEHQHDGAANMGAGVRSVHAGVAASRPASGVVAGNIYYATDTHVLSIWDGDTWENVSLS